MCVRSNKINLHIAPSSTLEYANSTFHIAQVKLFEYYIFYEASCMRKNFDKNLASYLAV